MGPRRFWHPTTRELVLLGLLVGLNVVLTRVASIRIAIGPVEGMRLGFGHLPVVLASLALGPVAGALTGALGDLLGYWVQPMGPYMPHFTAAAALGGALPGLLLRVLPGHRGLTRLVLAVGVPHLLVSCLLVPLILRHLFGIPLGATVVPRLVAAAFTVPAYALLCRALLERTRLTPFLSLPPRG